MPRVFKLTQKTVETTSCPPGRKDVLVFDGELRGFAMRVTESGSRLFLAQFTTAAGKRRVPIGRFGTVTVDEARRKAKVILGEAASGRDPFIERQTTAAAERKAKAESEYTVIVLIDAWSAAREGDRRPSYLREAVACLRRNLPDLMDRPAAGLTLSEAVRQIDRVKAAKGIVAANRTLAYARAAYGWAVKRDRIGTNPFKGLERAGRETARERVLSQAEMRAIWTACDALGNTLRGFTRMLMLTLQRRQEVASMQWRELDRLDGPTTWALPAARAKNSKAHIVHLSRPAIDIICSMPRLAGNPYVFAGAPSRRAGEGEKGEPRPIAAFNYAKAEIDLALAKAGVMIEPWVFHDFRRAGVTALADRGTPPHVCDRILNHVTGAITGVAAVYQRAEFLAERKVALDAWAEFVTGLSDRQAAGHAS